MVNTLSHLYRPAAYWTFSLHSWLFSLHSWLFSLFYVMVLVACHLVIFFFVLLMIEISIKQK
jgi:hypothetical protein